MSERWMKFKKGCVLFLMVLFSLSSSGCFPFGGGEGEEVSASEENIEDVNEGTYVFDANGNNLGAPGEVSSNEVDLVTLTGFYYEISWEGEFDSSLYGFFAEEDCEGALIRGGSHKVYNGRLAFLENGNVCYLSTTASGVTTPSKDVSYASNYGYSSDEACTNGESTLDEGIEYTCEKLSSSLRKKFGIPSSITGPLRIATIID